MIQLSLYQSRPYLNKRQNNKIIIIIEKIIKLLNKISVKNVRELSVVVIKFDKEFNHQHYLMLFITFTHFF